MPEKVSISECNRYIEINSSGSINHIEVKEAIERVVRIYKERGIDKVIVNSFNRNDKPSTGEALNVGRYLAVATEGKIKFAVLVNDEAGLDHITQIAAEVHGGLISYFKDIEAAKSWLEN